MPVLSPQVERAPHLLSRRGFLISGALGAAGMALYAGEIARHELEITTPEFRINGLPEAFDGFRIAQISDIHLEEWTEDFFLRHVIARVNALKPDLVLVTGDFISNGPLPRSVALSAARRCGELLGSLTCPLRFGVLGNHDAGLGSRFVREPVEAHGLPLLVNQHVRIERGGQHFYLAGVDDMAHGEPNLDLALPEQVDAPVILMAHEPDFVTVVARYQRQAQIDFLLCGHTHGGQVCLPWLGPIALPPLGKMYPHGHYNVGSTQLYVNRGIGTVGVPFRLNCPPEITLATLRRATASASAS